MRVIGNKKWPNLPTLQHLQHFQFFSSRHFYLVYDHLRVELLSHMEKGKLVENNMASIFYWSITSHNWPKKNRKQWNKVLLFIGHFQEKVGPTSHYIDAISSWVQQLLKSTCILKQVYIYLCIYQFGAVILCYYKFNFHQKTEKFIMKKRSLLQHSDSGLTA